MNTLFFDTHTYPAMPNINKLSWEISFSLILTIREVFLYKHLLKFQLLSDIDHWLKTVTVKGRSIYYERMSIQLRSNIFLSR